MTGIKKAIYQLDGYSVPQDFAKIKLNQNESPVDIPVEIKEEIFERLKLVSWNRYPASAADSLIGRIAGYTNFPSSGIIVGNGSNELIQTLLYAVCDSGDRILVVHPGFSIYKSVAAVMNIGVIEAPLKDNFRFDMDDIIRKGKKTELVILTSPNNPTGTALTVKEIEEIARSVDALVVVDEAYFEFYKETAQRLIGKLKNIIVLRTFSKALNLAGIRLGYLLGRKELVIGLFKAKLPFSVGIFQQVAGEVILKNKKFVNMNVERIIRERKRLYHELKKIRNIHPIPSYANFILFESVKKAGRDLYETLSENGVILRHFDSPRLKNMLRITVGTPEEIDTFLKKMRQIAKGASS